MPSAACCAAVPAISRSSRRSSRWRTVDALGDDPWTCSRDAAGGRSRRAVGARLPRVDGWPKVAGTDAFGADEAPADALWMRVVRSPHARARFTLGDLDAVKARTPGLAAILTAKDVPGENALRHLPEHEGPAGAGAGPRALPRRGGAGAGRHARRGRGHLATPSCRSTGTPERRCPASMRRWPPARRAIHAGVARQRAGPRQPRAAATSRRGTRARPPPPKAASRPRFVEHAYIEPEAGYAVPVGDGPDRIEVTACTQAPYMDLEETARVLGVDAVARAHPPDGLRRRLRRQARRVGAAAAGGGGVGDAAARAHRLHAHRIDGLHHQAPSGAHPGQVLGRRAGPPHRLRDAGRFQHRRLCLVGADGGEPRAGARHGALPGAERAAAARAPSTPTTRRPAPSAASACRRRRSRTRR